MIHVQYILNEGNKKFMSFDKIINYNDVVYLKCTHMRLTSLPKLPCSLKILHCSFNQLTSLPDLPYSLK